MRKNKKKNEGRESLAIAQAAYFQRPSGGKDSLYCRK